MKHKNWGERPLTLNINVQVERSAGFDIRVIPVTAYDSAGAKNRVTGRKFQADHLVKVWMSFLMSSNQFHESVIDVQFTQATNHETIVICFVLSAIRQHTRQPSREIRWYLFTRWPELIGCGTSLGTWTIRELAGQPNEMRLACNGVKRLKLTPSMHGKQWRRIS